jgi:hypothetical protein
MASYCNSYFKSCILFIYPNLCEKSLFPSSTPTPITTPTRITNLPALYDLGNTNPLLKHTVPENTACFLRWPPFLNSDYQRHNIFVLPRSVLAIRGNVPGTASSFDMAGHICRHKSNGLFAADFDMLAVVFLVFFVAFDHTPPPLL